MFVTLDNIKYFIEWIQETEIRARYIRKNIYNLVSYQGIELISIPPQEDKSLIYVLIIHFFF